MGQSVRLLLLTAVAVICGGQARAQVSPVPCDPARQETAENDLKRVLEGLNFVVDGIEEQDFDVQAKSIRWLGATSAEDLGKLSQIFINMLAFSDGISFLCLPATQTPEGHEIIAYVYNDQFTVHLTDTYFEGSETGEESRSSTMVHELSHLLLIGGTNSLEKDYDIYGAAGAEKLAAEDPERAQRNAENYALFFEDVLNGLN